MSIKLLSVPSFIAFLALLVSKMECQVPCETPDSRYGICVPVKQCQEVLNLLTQPNLTPQLRSYIRSFQCDHQGGTTYVCCPTSRERNTNVDVPVNNFDNDNNGNNGNNNDNENNNSNDGLSTDLLKPPQCGKGVQNVPRIVGGVPALLGEFPWMAALGFRNSKNPDMPKWLCGGALVTKRHVITAGHCIKDTLYLVRLGEWDLYDDNDGANPINVRIEQKIRHEDYNPSAHSSDIAILKLEDYEVPRGGMIAPICLPWEDELRNKNFERYEPAVAGWGAVNFNGPSSSKLMKVFLPVINNNNCQNKYGKQATIDKRILCAGFPTGGRDSCQGDSGGPMMLGRSIGLNSSYYYLIGVVSYGFRCAEPGYPGVYSRVTEFLPWITKNLV